MTDDQRLAVAVLGGSISGNKGAASMVYAVADGVRERLPGVGLNVFSPYPREDRQLAHTLDIVDFTPRQMIRAIPSALVALASGRRLLPSGGSAAVLARSDVVADVSGIAFMDGRGLATLAYNVLLVLLPWAFGVPVIKIAQALGPFDTRINRVAAQLVLPRVRWIGLRGSGTAQNVAGLRSVTAEPAADVAFLLEVREVDAKAAADELPEDRITTVVAPSAVVEESCRREGIDYIERMRELIVRLDELGHDVVLIAHSARSKAPGGHTNDLPLCRHLAELSPARLIDREIDAREIRAVIGRARLLITSRFHGMISGLATLTPTFVVGWSHKYREVLEEFGLQQWAVDFRDLTDDALVEAIEQLRADSESARAAMGRHIEKVRAEAELNIDRLVAVLEDAS